MTPEDIGLAGQGDGAALRRMRDHWLALASGEETNMLLPKREALPQLEMLAEMAAGSGEAQDQFALVVAYHIRLEALEREKEAGEFCAKQAVAANNVDDLERWASSVTESDEWLSRYRAKVSDLLAAMFDSSAGTAMLVASLSIQADKGDERAAPLLNCIIDSVTPERARSIQAEVRKIESEAAQ